MHEPGAETKIFQSVPGTVFLQNAVWGNPLLDQILGHDFSFGGRFIVTLSTGNDADGRRVSFQIFKSGIQTIPEAAAGTVGPYMGAEDDQVTQAFFHDLDSFPYLQNYLFIELFIYRTIYWTNYFRAY